MVLSHWDPLLSNPRVACHCDHALIYPRAATEWPPYGSRCPLPSHFHYRGPQIETFSWVLPIFNMVLPHWDPLPSNPRVACHCDHVPIYPRLTTGEYHDACGGIMNTMGVFSARHSNGPLGYRMEHHTFMGLIT